MTKNGGCTLDGIPAKALKMMMLRDSSRPIVPPARDRLMEINGLNGVLDFGADTGARTFNLSMAFITRTYSEMLDSAEQLAAILLDGYGKPRQIKLIFDARPDRYFLVRYKGSIDDIMRVAKIGRFTLPLIVIGEPYAQSLDSSDEEITWDSDVTWDSLIAWDDTWAYRVTGNGEITINNWGTMIVNPVIEIDGSFANLSISCNGKTFNYNDPVTNGNLVIDCKNLTVKLNGNNALKHMSGNFIELLQGDNEITISGSSLNFDIEFSFNAKYF